MGRVVYIDVLVILNIYVSFFLVKSTAMMLGVKTSKLRIFFAAALGGIYSLLILFTISQWLLFVVKLLMGITLVLTAFHCKSVSYVIKCCIYFFAVNFVYGGFMLALWIFVAPNNMVFKNGVVYFNISALTLTVSTILAYIAVSLICKLLNRRVKPQDYVDITIECYGKEVSVRGMIDTGNKLTDIFSGLPVIVCELDSIEQIFNQEQILYLKNPFENTQLVNTANSFRLIPISVVSGSSLLPAFIPDTVSLGENKKAAAVAVTQNRLSNGEFSAIVNDALTN